MSSLPIFRAQKWREHLRLPRDDIALQMLQKARFLPKEASPEQIEAALRQFRSEWARRNPTTPNPKMLQRLLENERLAAEAGKSPKALGLAVTDPIKTLAVLVEFPATDTFDYSAQDPATGECFTDTVTMTGPLHNQIVLGPRDNNTFWAEDFSPGLYEELYFGVGPDAGLVVNHPNLGPVDLRGYTVANFYLEQSEGAFKPEGMVYPKWLQAAHSEGWYGADSCETGSIHVRARDLVRETVDLINADDPNFPWQDFDGDGDGFVDNYTVIHAGMGQEAGGGLQGDFAIWSHAASVWPPKLACSAGSTGCPDRDIYVGPYSMDPENFDVGVGAEEYGHAAFGLPDIYTTDYTVSVADWAIMSAGSWNGPLGGMIPAPFPAWFRYVIGWWDPVEVDYDDPALEATIGQLSQRPEGTEYGMKINLPPREEFIPNLAGDGKGWKTSIPDLSFGYAWRFFDLSTATPPLVFSFTTHFEIEELWDYGFFEISTDGGATWTPIPDMDGLTTDENPNDVPGWRGCCGLTGEYEGLVRYDLSAYAGMSDVGVRFTYATDWGYQEAGWWVDNLSLDDATGNLYSNDLEDWSDWTLDGWIEVPSYKSYARYYLVEWRNYSGFDEGLRYPYQTVWADEDEWEVDRAPYSVPGMLLWLRDTGYDFDYTLGDSWFDPPSWGPKHALIVVDSHPFPRMWDWQAYAEWPPGVGLNLSGRLQPGDATFTLQETTSFTLRRGFTWVDDTLGYVPDIQETKTFEARAPVRNFHDYQGYYPGLWCCDTEGYLWWWDIDASAVLPAEGDYTTRITWWDNTPAYALYGINIGTVLGSGNPGDDDVQFGVNLCVLDQAEDGSWGDILFASFKLDGTGFVADPTEVLPGGEVEFTVAPNNLGGGAPVFVFVSLAGIPADLVPGSLTNGAFPIYGTWTSQQVAALYAKGGAEAVQALAADQGLPIAGIGWIGTVPGGLNELFRFRLTPWWEAQGTSFGLWADFYLCGDLATSLQSNDVVVNIVGPVTQTFDAAMDTYVSAWAPDASYGDQLNFSVRQPTVMDALLYFDLSSIPPLATVDSATLKLYPTYRTNTNKLYLSVYPLSESWDEGVTWNTAPAAGDTAAATMVLDSVGTEIELDVTNLVQSWVSDPASNYGLMLRGDGTKAVQFTFLASEAASLWPVLEVTYH